MTTCRQKRKSRRDEPSKKRRPPTSVLSILSAMIHIVYVKLETFSVAMLKAVSETSRIKAQTAIMLSNSVFQPRIKKNRGNSYFSKT